MSKELEACMIFIEQLNTTYAEQDCQYRAEKKKKLKSRTTDESQVLRETPCEFTVLKLKRAMPSMLWKMNY